MKSIAIFLDFIKLKFNEILRYWILFFVFMFLLYCLLHDAI